MTSELDPTLTDRFKACLIKPADFGHHDHLQVAFELLDRHDFMEVCTINGSAIDRMARSVGAPEKYNATITIAFLSVIAERRQRSVRGDFGAFLAATQDLLDPHALLAWSSPERLTSAAARVQFLMPDKAGFA